MNTPHFDKNNPFLASIKARYWLSEGNSLRQTHHVVLDLAGSGYTYNVGDSIAIVPVNVPAVVIRTIAAMKSTADTIVTDKRSQQTFTLHEFLSRKANLNAISRKFIVEITARQPVHGKKLHLEHLLLEENREAFKAFLEVHHIWDLLEENHEVTFTAQEIADLLMPLLPRYYSIASSQKLVGDEVHLTISKLHYNSNGHERYGVCTYYVCNIAPMNTPDLPVYIQPNHGFTLPEDTSTDIIMVGPGTGIAPFRAFVQERLKTEATGRNWLFFGEWHEATDYFYRELWEEAKQLGKLRVSTAFSRDQEHKIYVQNRMWEAREELYSWLESGAILYVCGDAHRMAKDVEAMLLRIVEVCGGKTEQEAKDYVKALRIDKRYLRDVY